MEAKRFIGKYAIVERIGRGSMGTVFKAEDPKLQRRVAVRQLAIDPEDVTPEIRERFYAAARASAAVIHPNIVTTYNASEDEGRLYLVTEFLDGEDVRRIVARGERLPLPAAIRVMVQLCRGLHQAHQQSVIHANIRPGSIVILRTGQPKIMDFGISMLATAMMPGQSGAFLGDPRYWAPEQADPRQRRTDALSDQYSLASVFYELLVLRAPFDDADAIVLLDRIRQDTPPMLEELDHALPADLCDIIHRALSKAPEKRFPDLGQMAEALEGVLHRIESEESAADDDYGAHTRRVARAAADTEDAGHDEDDGPRTRRVTRGEPGGAAHAADGDDHDDDGARTQVSKPAPGARAAMDARDRMQRVRSVAGAFGSSRRAAGLWQQADAHAAEAESALEEGRYLDALVGFEAACEAYRIANEQARPGSSAEAEPVEVEPTTVSKRYFPDPKAGGRHEGDQASQPLQRDDARAGGEPRERDSPDIGRRDSRQGRIDEDRTRDSRGRGQDSRDAGGSAVSRDSGSDRSTSAESRDSRETGGRSGDSRDSAGGRRDSRRDRIDVPFTANDDDATRVMRPPRDDDDNRHLREAASELRDSTRNMREREARETGGHEARLQYDLERDSARDRRQRDSRRDGRPTRSRREEQPRGSRAPMVAALAVVLAVSIGLGYWVSLPSTTTPATPIDLGPLLARVASAKTRAKNAAADRYAAQTFAEAQKLESDAEGQSDMATAERGYVAAEQKYDQATREGTTAAQTRAAMDKARMEAAAAREQASAASVDATASYIAALAKEQEATRLEAASSFAAATNAYDEARLKYDLARTEKPSAAAVTSVPPAPAAAPLKPAPAAAPPKPAPAAAPPKPAPPPTLEPAPQQPPRGFDDLVRQARNARQNAAASAAAEHAPEVLAKANSVYAEAEKAGSKKDYKTASARYEEAVRHYEKASDQGDAETMARADTAQQRMLAVRTRADRGSPEFAAGQRAEDQASAAYDRGDYLEAATGFQSAEAAYARARSSDAPVQQPAVQQPPVQQPATAVQSAPAPATGPKSLGDARKRADERRRVAEQVGAPDHAPDAFQEGENKFAEAERLASGNDSRASVSYETAAAAFDKATRASMAETQAQADTALERMEAQRNQADPDSEAFAEAARQADRGRSLYRDEDYVQATKAFQGAEVKFREATRR
ncbi:MAG TPA: protein kinase [Candidatus Binatia bacterium]|nr:protein kinase [Candidatus Binatia bacterium]